MPWRFFQLTCFGYSGAYEAVECLWQAYAVHAEAHDRRVYLYWHPNGLPLNRMDLCPEDVLDGYLVWTGPNRGASRYLLKLSALCLFWTSCAITRCREIMTPQLSIVKTRFAKASLRPRCARHRSWRATCLLPNRRAGTLSYPMLAWDTHLPNGCFGRQASNERY